MWGGGEEGEGRCCTLSAEEGAATAEAEGPSGDGHAWLARHHLSGVNTFKGVCVCVGVWGVWVCVCVQMCRCVRVCV